MRSILVTLLLLVAAIVIYTETVGGENGMKSKVYEGGNLVGEVIRRIDP